MNDKALYIDPRTQEARLASSGVSVWALIAYLQGAVDGDIVRTALDYDISVDDVNAAIEYYEQHRAMVDARILLNTAPSTETVNSSV